MREPKIKIAVDGKEKKDAYAQAKVNYKKAISGGYYGEALLIDYAIIEDRLKSFLYYAGGIIDKNNPDVVIDNMTFIEAFDLVPDKDKEGKTTGMIVVRDIGKKISVTKKVLKKAKEYHGEDAYLLLIKKALGSDLEIEDFKKALKSLEKEWIPKRNEIIHGLMNKNTKDLYEKYYKICEDGMEYANQIDNRVRAFKDRASIRKYLNLRMEAPTHV